MKDDYKFQEDFVTLSIKIEKTVGDKLETMTSHTGITKDEIVNMSLKRFIATHKDFFPPQVE